MYGCGGWISMADETSFVVSPEQKAVVCRLSYVLRGVRHGKLDDESYCFLHGFPTVHCGSWDPVTQKHACGNPLCAELPDQWKAQVFSGDLGDAAWKRRRSQECEECAAERKRRCRVLGSSEDLSPLLTDDPRFADAPYIHAFNEPKYHASQMRALHFARERQTMVLWLFAEDRPIKKIEMLQDTDISQRRRDWVRYHDQKTGGIMGLLPLVYDMPLRITETDHKRKHLGMFKNSRCRLFGWTLHPADQARYEECTSAQLVLQYMPQCLYLRWPGATWIEEDALGPGIAKVEPRYIVWALDKLWTQKIERRGFTIASDFSGTAHSFQGANLHAAIIDNNSWDSGGRPPNKKEFWSFSKNRISLTGEKYYERVCVYIYINTFIILHAR